MQTFTLPADPAFWQNPRPFFDAALATGGPLFDAGDGAVAALGHRTLHALARDPRADGHPVDDGVLGGGSEGISRMLRWGLFLQTAPLHRTLRHAVVAGLSAGRVDGLRPDVARIADEMTGALRSHPAPDLVPHFAKPLAARAFCALMGIDPRRVDELTAAMDAIGAALGGAGDAETLALADAGALHLLATLQALEDAGGSALLSDMAAALAPGAPARASDLAAAFAFDAIETTASALACALDVLLRQDGLAAALARGDFTVDNAVQEAFRLTSPTMMSVRMAREAIPVGDGRIEAGTTVFMWWPSANLDPRAFARPDAFDPVRGARGHLAFGGGPHACLGRRLTTLLAVEAFRALCPDDGPRAVRRGHTVYRPGLSRWPVAAPLRFVGD